jgi:hypothetical protein
MKFRIWMKAYASGSVEVEAETREEAIEKGENEFYAGLCHQCAREIELGDWEFGGEEDDAEVVT